MFVSRRGCCRGGKEANVVTAFPEHILFYPRHTEVSLKRLLRCLCQDEVVVEAVRRPSFTIVAAELFVSRRGCCRGCKEANVVTAFPEHVLLYPRYKKVESVQFPPLSRRH
jgi:hypothetical protein